MREIANIEWERIKARVEELILTGLTDRRSIAIAVGVQYTEVEEMIAQLKEKWVGERPKKNREARLLRIRMLDRIHRQASVEYEKSKKPAHKVVVEYSPVLCDGCMGTGKVGRGKCKACAGTGQIKKERITKTKEQRTGDPRYMMVSLSAIKEAIRLEGLGQQRRKTKEEEQLANHLHVHLQQSIDTWKNAPADMLIEAKILCDKLANIQGQQPKSVVDVKTKDDD